MYSFALVILVWCTYLSCCKQKNNYDRSLPFLTYIHFLNCSCDATALTYRYLCSCLNSRYNETHPEASKQSHAAAQQRYKVTVVTFIALSSYHFERHGQRTYEGTVTSNNKTGILLSLSFLFLNAFSPFRINLAVSFKLCYCDILTLLLRNARTQRIKSNSGQGVKEAGRWRSFPQRN